MSAVSSEQNLAARDVAVIIPVRAAGEMLRHCLAALAKASPGPGEIVVVVDGPGDRSHLPILAGFAALPIHLLELPDRVGAAAARNAGVRAARGRVLLFIDADVAIAPNAIAVVVDTLNRRPEWCAVFGSYDDRPGAGNFIAQYKGLLNHYTHQHARTEAFTFWTALGAIRREAFLAAGGFDVSSRLEDIELGYRLRAAGRRIGVAKTLLGTHLKPWRVLALIRSDLIDRAIPWTHLMLRHRSAERDLNLDTASRLSVVFVVAMLFSLAAAVRWGVAALLAAVLMAMALLMLNRGLYAFFFRKRGIAFMAGAIAWHWFYFLYGGVGFALGMLSFRARPAHAAALAHDTASARAAPSAATEVAS